ncbi:MULTISPECIES: M16 family metallopeptidase [Hydrocarboniphaga]|uniref:Insulinase family protein n=1 Tax=Hydrocarboniphaga effusa AP103 TaxID=1172194 RepID=I8T5K9_9GAMM|nr:MULTISPECIES: M16 family metallopeptidase [Hydrocarboniphaga]EIT68983.1 hypothetical protein WQQ_25650 [Hydrocarboniphaga effusa AP103]MDZ4081137.1 insulinase family protein [Hydrocarboniphaga sp.]
MAAPAQLHAFSLDNGLRVLLNEDRRLPLVAVHVAYRVGSADEAPGQHGLAHLFEHLMYGGSENLPGTYLSHLFAAGAHDLNGRTTLDSTHYFETVHRDALDFALFAEADRMGRLVLCEETLEKQRQVVLNELRQYRERSRGRLVERIDAECYPAGHPYRHGVIGSEADLLALRLDQAHEFRQRHYHAANAVLALAGDLTRDEAMRRCERAFGGLPAGPPITRDPVEVSSKAARSWGFDDASPSPQKRLVWQLPAMPSPDREGMRLFQIALESRLRAESSAGTSLPRIGLAFHRLATRLEFEWNAPDPARIERSFDAFEALWNRLMKSGFSASEAEQSRRLRWRQRLLNLDARSGVAALMIEGELAQGDLASAFVSRERLAAIDPTAVMRRCFAADDVGAAPWSLRSSADSFPASSTENAGPVSPRRRPPPASADCRTLENGLQLTLQARSGAELVSGRLLLRAGSSAEPSEQMGVAELCAEASLQARVGGMSWRQRAEAMGCEIGVEVQGEVLRLSWSSALAQWRDALALVEQFRGVAIDAEAFAAARSRQLAAIELASASAEAATQRVLPALLFDSAQASVRIASGLRSTVSALGLDQAIAFKQKAWGLADARCVLVGDLEPGEAIEALERWKAGPETTRPGIEAAVPKAASPSVHLLDIPGARQTLLTVAWALPNPARETEPALRALDLLLAGSFSSRLNLRLREELGWTYGVRSRLGDIAAARRYEIQAWIPAERSLDARAEILRAVEAFSHQRVDADALASLQRGEALRTLGRSERIEDAASEIEGRLRLGLDPRLAPDLSRVTAEQLREIATTRLDPGRAISLFAGDATRLRGLPSAAGLAATSVHADAEALYSRQR